MFFLKLVCPAFMIQIAKHLTNVTQNLCVMQLHEKSMAGCKWVALNVAKLRVTPNWENYYLLELKKIYKHTGKTHQLLPDISPTAYHNIDHLQDRLATPPD